MGMEKPEKEKVDVAVLGHGHLGKWHCEKAELIDSANLKFIVDPRQEAREKAQSVHLDAKVVAGLEEALPEVDACIVVTPTSTHFEIIKTLLENGKHVFCEKPLCESLEQVEEIGAILQRHPNLVLQVGHSERFHEAWEKLQEKEFEDFFRRPGLVRFTRVAPFKGRATDVDVVNDLMIHDLDLLLHLFKEIPSEVSSQGFKSLTSKWDFANSTFSFPSGRRAILTVSRNDVKEVRSMEVTNDSGHLHLDLMNQELTWVRGTERVQKLSFSRRDHLLIEQRHFYQSILERKPVVVSFEDGRWAVKLIGKVLEGLETGTVLPISIGR